MATATQTSVSNRRWLWVDTSDGQPRWGPSLVLADLPSETPQVPQSVLGYISQGHSSSPPSPSFSPAVHALLVVVCDERTPRHLQFVACLAARHKQSAIPYKEMRFLRKDRQNPRGIPHWGLLFDAAATSTQRNGGPLISMILRLCTILSCSHRVSRLCTSRSRLLIQDYSRAE